MPSGPCSYANRGANKPWSRSHRGLTAARAAWVQDFEAKLRADDLEGFWTSDQELWSFLCAPSTVAAGGVLQDPLRLVSA